MHIENAISGLHFHLPPKVNLSYIAQYGKKEAVIMEGSESNQPSLAITNVVYTV